MKRARESKLGDEAADHERLSPEEEKLFYDRLRRQIEEAARSRAGSAAATLLLTAPDFFVFLSRLVRDSRVTTADKLKLGAVLAYFIAPMDLFPEMILGPIGYMDDVALSAFVLDRFVNKQPAVVIADNWPGEERVISVIQRVLKLAEAALGGALWRRLRRGRG